MSGANTSSLAFTAIAALSLLAGTRGFAEDGPDNTIVSVDIESKDGGAAKAGQPVTLAIRVRDPASGYPITGLTPAAWFVPDIGNGATCEEWVNRLAGSPVPPPGVADLNGYDIIQLAKDGSLAIIDPRLNLATANIRSLTRLSSLPAHWAINPGGSILAMVPGDAPSKIRLFEHSPIAVRNEVEAGAGVVSLTAGEEDVLAGTADGRLLRISPEGTVLGQIPLGSGAVVLARGDDGGLVALAQDGHGLIAGDGGKSVKFAGVAGGARSVAYSTLADGAYILSADGRSLSILHRDEPGRIFTLPLEAEASRIVSSQNGQWLALPAADGRSVAILDTRTGSVRWTIGAEDPVRDVLFSDSFLYFTHARAGGVTRVVFDSDGDAPGIAMIAAGEAAATDREKSPMPLLVRVPGNGIIAASPERRVGFMVAEDGAQAAMSSLPLLAGDTAGLLLRYRGVHEVGHEGEYRADFVPEYGGRYLAVVRIDQPNLAHCRKVAFAGAADPALARPTAAAVGPSAVPRLMAAPHVGDGEVRFAVEGVPDGTRLLNAVFMSETGTWHRFVDVFDDGKGHFRFRTNIPGSGRYRFYAELSGQHAGETLALDVPVS